MTAGWSRIAAAPITAQRGRSRSAYATSSARPKSAIDGGQLHEHPQAAGRRRRWPCGRPVKGAASDRPDVAHDRPEGHGSGRRLAVERAEPVRGDVVDPADELVQVAAETRRSGSRASRTAIPRGSAPRRARPSRWVDHGARLAPAAVAGSDAAGDPVAFGGAVHRAELGDRPGRASGRRRPSRACRRRAARSGSRTG